MTRNEILVWLRESDPEELQALWRLADRARRQHVGNEVHLRGLIEISNRCVRQCTYCGIRAPNQRIQRYRMAEEEILECVRRAASLGYGTVVLQSGEDPSLPADWVAGLVGRIKSETRLAVTLSLGERTLEELELWRRAGADRYLLRFETSNLELFARIHPPLPGGGSDRIGLLGEMRKMGYEIGSGNLIGLPGQSWEDLAEDIDTFRRLDLDMIGVGPFIPHPDTPFGGEEARWLGRGAQVPNTEGVTYKVLALARLVCPRANIPATTALATVSPGRGREQGLQRGANVVMPNLTPAQYRSLYEIYPNRACVAETADTCGTCLSTRIEAIGRRVGVGRGDSPNRLRRAEGDAETSWARR